MHLHALIEHASVLITADSWIAIAGPVGSSFKIQSKKAAVRKHETIEVFWFILIISKLMTLLLGLKTGWL